jgi:hypothetical protein
MKKFDLKSKLYLLPDSILFLSLLFLLFLISLVCFCNIYPEGDVMEHIKASFKVYNGQIPYKDFFEHHHPLLWYLTGWFVALFEGMDTVVIYVVDYVTFLFFAIGVFYIYKIMNEFISGRTEALLSVLFMLCPGLFLYYIYFKPDNYVSTCISVGLYYFFRYMRDMKRRDLVVSYFLYWLAFMFLQKALLFYPVLGGVSLYLLYKKDIKSKDFFISLIVPAVLTVAFVCLWIYLGIWDLYWTCNFEFNSAMREYMGEHTVNKAWFLANVFFVISLFSMLISFCMNKYFRILCFVLLINLAFNFFYFSPHIYYYYASYYFAVPVAIAGIFKVAEKNRLLKFIVISQSLLYIWYMSYLILYDVRVSYIKMSKPYSNVLNLYKSVNKCDYVYYPSSFIYSKDIGYYWFLLGQLDVIGEKVGIKPVEDINKLIEDKKPKVVAVKDIYDRYEKIRGNEVLVHKFDIDMIERFYDKFEINNDFMSVYNISSLSNYSKKMLNIYVLKPEYWRTNCKYNIKNKEWQYE